MDSEDKERLSVIQEYMEKVQTFIKSKEEATTPVSSPEIVSPIVDSGVNIVLKRKGGKKGRRMAA